MATTTLPVTSAADLRGLERLRHGAANDDPKALAEAAVQFEALFIGMMLESARSASLGSGLFDGPQTEQYLELMDQQVALEVARRGGFGFGKLLMQQLGEREAVPSGERPAAPLPIPPAAAAPGAPATTDAWVVPAIPAAPAAAPSAAFPQRLPPSLGALGGADAAASAAVADAATARATDFVSRLLPEARKAAAALGVEPKLLLAQAALETGWGKSLDAGEDAATNNLFGIKTGASWQGQSAFRWTLEHVEGVTERKQEPFRAYPDTASSFADYVELIGTSPRYAKALEQAQNPSAYAHAVAAAGYATDPAYASKWLAIYHGDRLDGALRGVEGTGSLE